MSTKEKIILAIFLAILIGLGLFNIMEAKKERANYWRHTTSGAQIAETNDWVVTDEAESVSIPVSKLITPIPNTDKRR